MNPSNMRKHHKLMVQLLKHSSTRTSRKSFNFTTSANALSQFPEHEFHVLLKRSDRRRELARLLQSTHTSRCKEIHGHVILLGFQHDVFLSNIILHLYSKWDCLYEARQLFDTMSNKNLVTWSSVVSMYTQHNYNEEALMVFLNFRSCCSEYPSEFIFTSSVRACTQLGTIRGGVQLHGLIVRSGFVHDVFVGTSLVDLYAKHGSIHEARLVFDGLGAKNTVTWTIIITAYGNIGRCDLSLELFCQMRGIDVHPDRYVLSSVLSACSELKFLQGGKQIHAYVLRRGVELDISALNVLIDVYTKCHRVDTGRKVFNQIVDKNIISWTTMIAGYMQNSFHSEAMNLFIQMFSLGLKPDCFACTSSLNSCGSLEALKTGTQVHAYTIKVDVEDSDFVRSALIDMYAKCDSLTDARRVFDTMVDTMVDTNVISYNAMIEGYSRQGKLHEAFDLFDKMRIKSCQPNLLTFVSLLGLSASLFSLELSQQIHSLITKFGFYLDMFAGSSLVDVYSKCSRIRDAQLVFEEIKEKDVVMWNAMISGYTQQLESEEAVKLYKKILISGQRPNEYTLAAAMTASSNLASLHQGRQFHNQLIKMGLDNDHFVTNALVDMYSNCGDVQEAHRAFSTARWKDIVCWNSIISTYAQHGEAVKALEMFERMISEGIKPNYVTFVGVLSACSHAGLVDLGLSYFNSMTKLGIEQGTEHYACVVSLMGRAGKILEAKRFIEAMPINPEVVVWRSLLSACRIVGNVEIGSYAAEMTNSRDPDDSGSYVLMSNIFASKGMWVDVKRVREKMDIHGVVKEPGCSWIESINEVQMFIARDTTHQDSELIYSVLDSLLLQIKRVGYVSDTITLAVND